MPLTRNHQPESPPVRDDFAVQIQRDNLSQHHIYRNRHTWSLPMMAGSLHDMHSKRNGDPKGAAPRFLVFTSAFLFRAERYAEAARSWALATMLERSGFRVFLFGPDCRGYQVGSSAPARPLAPEESLRHPILLKLISMGPVKTLLVLMRALSQGPWSESTTACVVLHNGGWMSFAAWMYAQLRPSPYLHLDLMGIADQEAALARYRFWKGKARIFRYALRKSVLPSHILTTVNAAHADAIRRLYGRDAVVIPDRLPEDRMRRLGSLQAPTERPTTTLFFMGSLSSGRLDLFLRVCRDLIGEEPSLRVVVCGNGSDLERYKAEFGSERILFPGYIGGQRLLGYLADADICYSDVWSEIGTPYKLIEYMAAGRAIVTHKTPAVDDLIADGIEGVVCEPRRQDLKNALQSLIDNKDLRRRLGARAREKAIALHTVDWRARLVALYQSLPGWNGLGENGPGSPDPAAQSGA